MPAKRENYPTQCVYPGCDIKPTRRRRGFCNTHYCQEQRTGTMWPIGSARSYNRLADPDAPCATDGCTERQERRGRCGRHYRQLARHGYTFDGPRRRIGVTPCPIQGCDQLRATPHVAYCTAHNREARRHERLYGITLEERLAMERRQNGRCLLCLRDSLPLHLDHCHQTQTVRGLLCGGCNRGIGLLGHDKDVLRRAVAYVAGG